MTAIILASIGIAAIIGFTVWLGCSIDRAMWSEHDEHEENSVG